ncbi:hypothetical protein D8Y22_05535 [Salinadaptatus halalkaliphilus]|uniref:Uncharacterized protein n=1 Tax=Salinadaptatus halalkaliphilus TaxID=2419781 RepID=A0A4V3VLJ7_9EURY|nr:hypothetical protein D8Y22_05535 [Salinadaptatus halalkaliphilus]
MLAHGYLEVDKELVPLIEESRSWFESAEDQYQMAAGGFGTIESFSPGGATFAWVNNLHPAKEFPHRRDNFEALVAQAETQATVVPDRATGIQISSQERKTTTWRNVTPGGDLEIFERVPFEETVTDFDTLETELSRIMESPPDFDLLERDATAVAKEMEAIPE